MNGKIKQWRYFAHVIQNSSIPSVGVYLNKICALINTYGKRTQIDTAIGRQWAAKMKMLLDEGNHLQTRLERLAQSNKKPQWKKYDAQMVVFPTLSEQDVRNICFGKR